MKKEKTKPRLPSNIKEIALNQVTDMKLLSDNKELQNIKNRMIEEEKIKQEKFDKFPNKNWICERCDGIYKITGSYYDESIDWFFSNVECKNCGYKTSIPEHMLKE